MKKIYLDPGHGGNDVGAVNGTRYEKNDVLRLGLLVREELAAQDVEVMMSRENDSNPGGRTAAANAWGADYYLAIHRNAAAASATGNEIWVISTATQDTVLKARAILDAVCKTDGLPDRGVKKGAPGYTDFGVNRDTRMASALLELGFISSAGDNAVFDRCINAYAKAIAKALCEVVGAEYRETRIPGDVNGDGKVTVADARLAQRAALELETLTDKQKKAADMNGDGKVAMTDAREILRKGLELEDGK